MRRTIVRNKPTGWAKRTAAYGRPAGGLRREAYGRPAGALRKGGGEAHPLAEGTRAKAKDARSTSGARASTEGAKARERAAAAHRRGECHVRGGLNSG